MVLYSVHWQVVPENIKYANRLDRTFFMFSVQCRSITDAAFTDSRGFNPTYLYADDIKEPLYLGNLKKNRNIF